MRTRNATLFSCILLFLMACHVDSVNMPATDVSAFGLNPSFIVYSDCPDGRQCVPAENLGPVTPITSNLVPSCAGDVGCMGDPNVRGSITASVTADEETGNIDVLTMTCTNGVFKARSDHACWDCVGGCGGSVGPDDIQWQTVTVLDPLSTGGWMGQAGSDCYAFRCQNPNAYWFSGQNKAPLCFTDVPPPPPPPPPGAPGSPYTYASVVSNPHMGWASGNPYLYWDGVSGAAAYRVYRQLHWQEQPDVWYTWLTATSYQDESTGVSGSPQSQPDLAWDKWVRYHVVSLAADGTESGYVNVHYYYGSGPY